MKRLFFLTLVLLAAVSCSVSRKLPAGYPSLPELPEKYAGRLEAVIYPTSVPGPSERRMFVYLPSDYCDSCARYPVLYVLHGARGDEMSWIVQGNVLPMIDSLRESGASGNMLVVFPNMNSYDSEADFAYSRHKGGIESFFEVDGCVESSFVKDVVGAVDSLFFTVQSKEGRALAGLSLGGMQTMYISASNPDIFGYVGIFSAPVHSALRKGPYSSFYDGIESKIDAQFSDPPFLYAVYVGKKDIYKSTMEKFCRELEKKAYRHEFHLDNGGHQWPQWTGFLYSFMESIPASMRAM